jgi:plastocyanin
LPYSITISIGDVVQWDNPDSAAHTVTSGNIADGHDGIFDSGLFMAGGTFENISIPIILKIISNHSDRIYIVFDTI